VCVLLHLRFFWLCCSIVLVSHVIWKYVIIVKDIDKGLEYGKFQLDDVIIVIDGKEHIMFGRSKSDLHMKCLIL